jgi:hypothetical protein
MNDAERFKLLHGPCRAPRCKIGQKLWCEMRGWVIVRGMSEGRVAWPVTRVNRATAFIVCAGLAEAIRRESASAVCYWWGITPQTVTKWRKALDVPTYNEGTTKLWSKLSAEFLTPEVQKRARKKANSPEMNAKKRAGVLGREVSPKQAVALAQGRRKLALMDRGAKPRGPAPNWDRRLLVVQFRAKRWELSQIAEKLGWTKQYVHSLLRSAEKAGVPMPLNCCNCDGFTGSSAFSPS